jgi:hypothetical protein
MLCLRGRHVAEPTELRWALASVVPRTKLDFSTFNRTKFLDDHHCGRPIWLANGTCEYVCDEDCNADLVLIWTRYY